MLEVESNNNSNNNLTILDYLNEDCWRIVLGYVPVLDIIRTERTSRRWQRVVLIHLQRVRFRITSLDEENDEMNKNNIEFQFNTCSLRLLRYGCGNEYYESFASWICKLGPSVVASYCKDLESLNIIRANCPNLEALTLFHMYDLLLPKDISLHNLNKDFKRLKNLCFYESHASDDCISQFIEDRALEELEFCCCYDLTGQCLNIVKLSNLKSLVFNTCYSLESSHLLTCITNNQLNELTKLVLNDVPIEICCDVQLVLEKMFKLEWLEILPTTGCLYSHARNNQPDLLHIESLCKLSCLKYLKLGFKVTDNVVEAITKCFKELKHLEFSNCKALSSQVVEAICHNAGASLITLGLHAFYLLDDDDMVACINGCPNLIRLSVSGACYLTPALPARAVAARHKLYPGHCLHLIISDTNLSYSDAELEEECEDLIIITVDY